MTNPSLITSVRSTDGARADLAIAAAQIPAVGPHLPQKRGVKGDDGALPLALPGGVEGRTHLHETLWREPVVARGRLVQRHGARAGASGENRPDACIGR